MRTTFPPILASVLFVASMLAAPLHAQTEPAVRVAGTLERVDGNRLVVKTPQGDRAVSIARAATVYALVKATLADIKPGVFVGVGAKPQPDGSQQAIRLVIFPEAMRGLGEGHRPWDRPGTTMTNATVDNSVTSVDGQVLTVKYKGGEKKIVVRPDTVIATYIPAERKDLTAGASVTATGVANAGGEVEARRIVVDRTASR